MYPRCPDPLNIKILTSSCGDALRLAGGNIYLPDSSRLLYQPRQTCWMILVPILLVSSDEAASGKFSPPHFICIDMP